jgi:hypothetical protein
MALKVRETFFASGRVFPKGSTVDASDPVVAGRGHLFVDDEPAGVEQATANPGELRAVKRPARKRAAKPKG